MVIRGLGSISLPHTFKRPSITPALQPWSGPKHMTLDVGAMAYSPSILLSNFSAALKKMPNSAGSFGDDTKQLSLKKSFTHVTPLLSRSWKAKSMREAQNWILPQKGVLTKLFTTVYSPKLAQNLMNTCSVAAGHWLESSVTPGCRSVVPCLALTGVLYPPPSGPQIPAFGFWLPNDNTCNLADPSFHPPSTLL